MPRTSFRRAITALAALAATAAALGCEPTRYLYAPATTTLTSAAPAESRNAEYPFPPDSPHGEIRLATAGLAKASEDAPATILVRMTVRNRSDERWVVDTREQTLVLATRDYRRAPATLASPPARIEIPPSGSATIDLAFTVPVVAPTASEIPAFDTVWTVHVGARAVTTRTTFERLVAPGVARDLPAPSYPFNQGMPTTGERLPGTTKWTETQPLPDRGLE